MVDFLSYLTSFRLLVPLGLVSLPLLVLLVVVVTTFVNSPAHTEAHSGSAPLETPPVPSTAPVTSLPPEGA